jgi:hypothetical protein
MFQIGGKFRTSLADHSFICITSNNTINLIAVISDPVLTMFATPPEELAGMMFVGARVVAGAERLNSSRSGNKSCSAQL